jgi:adenylate cyclase
VAARLEGLAEPGGICVSGRVHEDTHGKLDVSFEDMGEQQLKNISRPIRVYRVVPSCQEGALRNRNSGFLSRRWKVIGLRRAGMALVAALLVLFGAAYWRFQRSEPQASLAHRLSMVVLPFKNLSNEPEQEYFAEGITDDPRCRRPCYARISYGGLKTLSGEFCRCFQMMQWHILSKARSSGPGAGMLRLL